MRICKDCKLTLNDSDSYCPSCGRNTLEVDPNDAASAAAVGAIYEERGMLDEAAVWYRVALDKDPSDTSFETCLNRINALIAAKRQVRPEKTPTKGRISNVHIFAAAGVVTCIIIALIIFLVISAGKKSEPSAKTSDRSSASVSVVRPTPRRATHSSQSTANTQSTPLEGERTAGSGGTKTAGEVAINNALQESDAVRATGTRIDDVIADPRQGVVTVTIVLPASGNVNEDAILRAAAVAAKTTVTANSEVKFVTVRALMSSGDARATQIAFVGDAARSSVESLSDNPDPNQLKSVFTNPWWIKYQAGVSR